MFLILILKFQVYSRHSTSGTLFQENNTRYPQIFNESNIYPNSIDDKN